MDNRDLPEGPTEGRNDLASQSTGVGSNPAGMSAIPFIPAFVVHDECICKGNWRLIVKEAEHLINRKFVRFDGNVYRFFGIVHGSDDYYYGMWSKDHGLILATCVGSIEGNGFTLLPDSAATNNGR